MIERGMDRLVAKAKKDKKWKPIPDAPRAKLIQLKTIYTRAPEVMHALELYELFRDLEKLEKVRENEFRKGVNLKVTYKEKIININLNQLKEYAETLEKFISYIK
ncbi:MAG: hypothetical protein KKD18_06805 [Nanoarchaeota archaeon]|nr:hypothetical protein [Nanoarchaeota archaeon]MBU0978101.1 hypothetical protein [Nanoarchaeota archaeon]